MSFLSGLLSVAAPIVGTAIGGPLGGAIGAGIGAAGNAFGASANNKHQLELIKQLIEALKELLKNLNDWNELMWNKLNEYNTPAHLRQLYEEAGLNPAYFLGEGRSTAGSVGANTISAPSVPTPAGNFQGLGSIGDVASLALIDSLIRKNNSDAGLSESELKTLDELREYEVKYKKALADKTEEEVKLVKETVNKIKADTEYIKALKVLTDTLKQLLDLIIEWMPLLNQAQLNEVLARIEKMKAETELTDVLKALAPVFARAAIISANAAASQAEAANKLADAAQLNADTNAKVGESVVTYNKAAAGNLEASTEYTNSKTTGQNIENEIAGETKGTRIFKENLENTVGTVNTQIDNLWNTGTKIFTDVTTGGATATVRNVVGSHKNPVSRSGKAVKKGSKSTKKGSKNEQKGLDFSF